MAGGRSWNYRRGIKTEDVSESFLAPRSAIETAGATVEFTRPKAELKRTKYYSLRLLCSTLTYFQPVTE